jgi:hypothetical protein
MKKKLHNLFFYSKRDMRGANEEYIHKYNPLRESARVAVVKSVQPLATGLMTEEF